MVLGTLTSFFAAGWKFITKGEDKPESRPLMRLYALTDQIGKARNEADLAEAERHIAASSRENWKSTRLEQLNLPRALPLAWRRIALNI
jgi:hypothetical protein